MFNKENQDQGSAWKWRVQHYEATVMGWYALPQQPVYRIGMMASTNNIQVMAELGGLMKAFHDTHRFPVSSHRTGNSLGKGQRVELKAATIEILGDSDAEPHCSPKTQSWILREIAHLRFPHHFLCQVPCASCPGICHSQILMKTGFVAVHTPLLRPVMRKAGKCSVTTLSIDGSAPKNEDGINHKEDFCRSTNPP